MADTLYVIQEGFVTITDQGDNNDQDYVVGPGSVFGSSVVVSNKLRRWKASSIGKSSEGLALAIDKNKFNIVAGDFELSVLNQEDQKTLVSFWTTYIGIKLSEMR
jgi:hypothetical protein